jgi:hypothetical protein
MQKFNVQFSDDSYDSLVGMSERLDRPMAEVLRESLSVYRWLMREVESGNTLMIQRGDKPPAELLLPYFEDLKVSTAAADGRRHGSDATSASAGDRRRSTRRRDGGGRPNAVPA